MPPSRANSGPEQSSVDLIEWWWFRGGDINFREHYGGDDGYRSRSRRRPGARLCNNRWRRCVPIHTEFHDACFDISHGADFETPADATGDNIYDVTVQVSDGAGGFDTQQIAVTVTNVDGISPPPSNAATITGTSENDVLTGLDATNLLQGLEGNDTLSGAGSNDTLNGGSGADTLTGGLGNDTLNGDSGNDIFRYTFGDGTDTVNGGAGNDTLNILGTTTNDTLDVIFNGSALTRFKFRDCRDRGVRCGRSACWHRYSHLCRNHISGVS